MYAYPEHVPVRAASPKNSDTKALPMNELLVSCAGMARRGRAESKSMRSRFLNPSLSLYAAVIAAVRVCNIDRDCCLVVREAVSMIEWRSLLLLLANMSFAFWLPST